MNSRTMDGALVIGLVLASVASASATGALQVARWPG
ncbi:hypothetical protein BH09GEM1_BH09GEM1_45880 [soil metagenome]